MKTIKHFALTCLILILTAYFSDVQAIGIHSGTRALFLQERYKHMSMNHSESGIPLLRTNQGNSNRNPMLKSGDLTMHRLDNLVNQYWDAPADKWEPNYKQEYSYESNGNMVQAIYSSKDPWTGQWMAGVKECYMYYSKGKVSRYISYNWSDAKNQWIASVKQEHFYSQDGSLTSSFCYLWDPAAIRWSVTYKMENITDPHGNISRTLSYKWDGTGSQWKNEWKDEYQYDSMGNMTMVVASSWSESSGTWVNSFKDEYLYNEKGNQVQTLYYRWSDGTKWSVIYRDEFAYDDLSNLKRLISYQRIEISGEWAAVYMEENIFNNSVCLSNLILPFSDNETNQYFCHLLNSITEYDMNSVTGKWDLSNRIDFNYSRQLPPDFVNSLSEPVNPGVRISPNPASEYVMIWFSFPQDRFDFNLFDVKGRKLFSAKMAGGGRIPLAGFESGVYFYEVIYGNKKENGKLVIR